MEDEKEVAEASLHFLNNILAELEVHDKEALTCWMDKSVGSILDEKFHEHLAKLNDTADEPLRKAVFDWFIRYILLLPKSNRHEFACLGQPGKYPYE